MATKQCACASNPKGDGRIRTCAGNLHVWTYRHCLAGWRNGPRPPCAPKPRHGVGCFDLTSPTTAQRATDSRGYGWVASCVDGDDGEIRNAVAATEQHRFGAVARHAL